MVSEDFSSLEDKVVWKGVNVGMAVCSSFWMPFLAQVSMSEGWEFVRSSTSLPELALMHERWWKARWKDLWQLHPLIAYSKYPICQYPPKQVTAQVLVKLQRVFGRKSTIASAD